MIKLQMIGNLGADPKLRTTPGGTPVCSFSLAANRGRGDKKTTDWVEVNVFGNSANTAAQYLHKGDTVYVEGTEEVGTWTKSSGEVVATRKLNTNNVEFVYLRNNGASDAASAKPEAPAEAPPIGEPNDSDVPF